MHESNLETANADARLVKLTVNGEPVEAMVEPRVLLVDFLRRHARVTGPRIGCEEGACGACTVDVDGTLTKSCLLLAVQTEGSRVTTVEGTGSAERLSSLQQAFVKCHAAQCGFCTAGMLMSARAFLARKAGEPFTDDEVRHAISGNYCRCTGYNNIIRAVKVAAGLATPLAAYAEELNGEGGWIGKPVARREDRRLVTGGGRYVDNFGTADDLYLAVARSTRGHARLQQVDTTHARAMPGVVLTMTGREALPHWKPMAPSLELLNLKLPRRYAIAIDTVVFYGEPVALVAARTPAEAEDAARAIVVEYEDLPVVVDAEQSAALGPDAAALLYPEWGTNVQVEFAFNTGAIDERFAAADLVVEETIVSQRFGAMPMEARAVHANYDQREQTLVVRTSTQVPHTTRMFMSHVFDLPESRVQVLAGDVGGGFGAKLSIDTEYLPALASIVLGRPVKWIETRAEWIFAGPAARDFRARCRAAFRRDGTLLAQETDIVADMGCDGAERGCGLGMPINGGIYAVGPYRVADYRTRVRCVVTNKAPYSAYRGYGKDLANMFSERLLDQAAARLGIDPVEIRRRNLLTSYPHQLCTGPIIENGSLREALDTLVERMDLPALRQQQAEGRRAKRYLGIGIAPYIEPCGVAFPGSSFQNYESATVRVGADGSVHVMTGIQNIGQGIETAYAQVTADTLGCRLSDVSLSWGDTTANPFGSGTFSSRGAMYAVGAIVAAAKRVKARLLAGAAVLLQCPAEELAVEDGVFFRRGWDASCTLKELAYAAYVQPGAEIILAEADAPLLEATDTYRHPQVNWKADEQGRAQFYPSHPGGAEAALVEVDPETGWVDVLKIWMISDHGVVLNPVILSGQTKGAVVQQIGGTLYESLGYDAKGIPLARTLKEYGMPTVWAAPEIEVDHLVTKSPATSVGAKGAGEDGCIATSTVLLAAVEDALRPFGVKVMESPLSPARVYDLIQRASLAANQH